jgi:hypothetical protein
MAHQEVDDGLPLLFSPYAIEIPDYEQLNDDEKARLDNPKT